MEGKKKEIFLNSKRNRKNLKSQEKWILKVGKRKSNIWAIGVLKKPKAGPNTKIFPEIKNKHNWSKYWEYIAFLSKGI